MTTTPDLFPLIVKLLACVDFSPPPYADVCVVNLWGAAQALEELQKVVEMVRAESSEER